jgi:hypothetical protein
VKNWKSVAIGSGTGVIVAVVVYFPGTIYTGTTIKKNYGKLVWNRNPAKIFS